VHAASHWPFTQNGVGALHCELPVQVVPVGFGSQPPFTHVKPSGQVVEQPVSHFPSMHTFVGSPQSLLNLHAFVPVVHTPPTQTSVPVQSVVVLHGHGPFAPPHVWHWPPTHACPVAQSLPFLHCGAASAGGVASVPPSAEPGTHLLLTHCSPLLHSAFVVHSFTGPGCEPGGTHWLPVHTSPCGQSLFWLHVVTQPESVQTWPAAQFDVPVHGVVPGGDTFRHP